MNICHYCGTELSKKQKFCSRSCAATFNNAERKSRGWTQTVHQRQVASMLRSKNNRSRTTTTKGTRRVQWIEHICPECNNVFQTVPSRTRKYCSLGCSSKHLGGAREGSGKSKSGYYRGIYCGSSYELAWVIYRLDHDLPVKRFPGHILYGDNKKYFPDFLDGNIIYEMKGWLTTTTDPILKEKTEAAESQGYQMVVLFLPDLSREFDWVKQTYKPKYMWDLYDNVKYEHIYQCSWCAAEIKTHKPRLSKIICCSRSCVGKFNAANVLRK